MAKKSKNSAPNDVASLRGLVAAAGIREAKLLSNASTVSSQIERATAELRQARDTILMHGKKLAKHCAAGHFYRERTG